MSVVVIVGAQWGDEGKGKITDYLAEKADLIVRYQGGNNAGHTVIVGDNEYKLHLVPSGVLYKDKTCVIGNGVVIDPSVLVKELDYLEARGIDTSGIRISDSAHLIMPYHRLLDNLEETRRGSAKIGTTGRGIGPAYMDKSARVGIRVMDLLDKEDFEAKLERNLLEKNYLLVRVFDSEGFKKEEIMEEYLAYAERIRPYVVNTSILINEAIAEGKNVLFEGAQGTLLDLDHGTYPFVTSSHPIAGAACIGAGVGPTKINKVMGIIKAYTTRVGEGPFPTELTGEMGELVRTKGGEFGTTTGRPRRCGWFDAAIGRHAVRVSGLDCLAVTKLDVLDDFESIKICTGYKYKDQIIKEFPSSLKVLAECEPVYEEMPGWMEKTSGVTSFDELPLNAKKYLERLQEILGVELAIVSVGSKRTSTIFLKEIF